MRFFEETSKYLNKKRDVFKFHGLLKMDVKLIELQKKLNKSLRHLSFVRIMTPKKEHLLVLVKKKPRYFEDPQPQPQSLRFFEVEVSIFKKF